MSARSILISIFIAIIMCWNFDSFAERKADNKSNEKQVNKVHKQWKYKDYEVLLDADCVGSDCKDYFLEGAIFTITKKDKLIYSEKRSGDRYSQDLYFTVWTLDASPIFNNFTGDGKPGLVIESQSGGNHCCQSIVILSLDGDKVNKVASFSQVHGNTIIDKAGDMDGKPGVELLANSTYSFGPESAATYPEFVLRYDNKLNKYVLAEDLTKKKPLTKQELEKEISDAQAKFASADKDVDFFEIEIKDKLLDLIYGGNYSQALQIADAIWHNNQENKKFIRSLREDISSNQYGKDILKMNGI